MGVEVPGLSVTLKHGLSVGALRYFDARGPLAANLPGVVGGPLPAPLKASRYVIQGSEDEVILAWRSPRETVLVTLHRPAFESIARCASAHADGGCLVEQTAGVHVWQAGGVHVRDLLERLGSTASIPALGEARTSRLAELPVLALCVHEAKILLLVERVYSEHLLGWISETAADL